MTSNEKPPAAQGVNLKSFDREILTDPFMKKYPRSLSDDAYRGAIGELVSVIEPHTISDKHALFLTACTQVGHFLDMVGQYENRPSLFTLIVGETSVGKGTSWRDCYRHIYQPLAKHFKVSEDSLTYGFSSGEGILKALEGDNIHLLILLEEFKMFLTGANRQVSTSKEVFLKLFDGSDTDITTKTDAQRVRNPRVELIGHITNEALVQEKQIQEWARDGFLNRMLWCAVEKKPYTELIAANQIPADSPDYEKAFATLLKNLDFVRSNKDNYLMVGNAEGRYRELVNSHQDQLRSSPAIFQSATERYRVHLLRLAMIVAAAEGAMGIAPAHLNTADKWVQRSHESMDWILDLNEPNEDEQLVLDSLSANEPLTRTQISNLFNRHKNKTQINQLASSMVKQGLVTLEYRPSTGGAPTEIWRINNG